MLACFTHGMRYWDAFFAFLVAMVVATLLTPLAGRFAGAVITLVVPLIVLALPFLDTGFVVAKRLKYRRKPWSRDTNHFHHRTARTGYSQRRTVAYLYGWTLLLAGVALALRFVPYSNHGGTYHLGWLLVMAAIGLVALAASVYLIYLLEILKFKNRRSRKIRATDPATGEHEIDQWVRRKVETGELERVR